MNNSTQKKAKTSDEIDRISQLPDEILHHILSFVDIFDVVGLSVLSRRWKDLWTTMPYLDFDIVRFHSQRFPNALFKSLAERFRDFINWVLIYQGSTNITRFRLRCAKAFDGVQIMRWIRAAARRNVQEFELDFQYYGEPEQFELPYCLSTCESLRVLKLSLSWRVLQLPSHLKFKQLRSLHLDCVELIDEDLTRIFFSECSVLEDLSLKDCTVRNMKVLDISSSSLKCLTIDSYCDDDDEFDFDGVRNCEIRISCPNLLSFTYMGLLARNYCLDNLSSLEKLCISISTGCGLCSPEEVGRLASKILKDVENIRLLKLHFQDMSCLSHVIEELRCFSTSFHRVKSLNVSVGIDERYTQAMFLLLKHCPNLESLTLFCQEIQTERTIRNKHWQLPDEGHTYWESRLKSVRLINFVGDGHELRFVKFMLKNGLALEEFIIILSKDAKKSPLMNETVLKFPKASSLVAVKIVPK